MNDKGQLAFITDLPGSRQVLILFSDGKFFPIAAASGPAPGGKTWPEDVVFGGPVNLNQAGDIAFEPADSSGSPSGVYLWDSQKQSVIPVATPGTPADRGLTFVSGGNPGGALMNNRGEIGFLGFAPGATGPAVQGAFVRRQNGQVQAVALPGDSLPGSDGSVGSVNDPPLINDAGLIAFDVWSTHDPTHRSSYLWEKGSVSVIIEGGVQIPGFGKVTGSFVSALNDANSSVLIGAKRGSAGGPGLFLWDNGQFTPVLVAGQEMSGYTKSNPAEAGSIARRADTRPVVSAACFSRVPSL